MLQRGPVWLVKVWGDGMTAKEYLTEIQSLKEDIRISRKIVENFHISYSSMHGIDYSGSKVQSSPKNSLEEAAWRMLEQHDSAVKHLWWATSEMAQRLSMIRSLSKPIYCQILYMRYYDGMEFQAIADKVKKEPGTVGNLHGEALKEFGAKYAEILKKAAL